MTYKHTFKKSFGQNFLKSDKVASLMVTKLDITPNENIIEIGSGEGALTSVLLKTGNKIFSVEIDNDLIKVLEEKFGKNTNFNLIHMNILDLDIDSDGSKKYSVIGSLPYNISKKIINKFVLAKNKPRNMVILIQKEVGIDYCCKAPKASFLSNYIQIFADAFYIKTISKSLFYPKPKVDGAIILFKLKEKMPQDYLRIISTLKSGFLHPRKILASNLQSLNIRKNKIESFLNELNYSRNVRAEQIKFEDWLKINSFIRSENVI